jgi:hypothetical protein
LTGAGKKKGARARWASWTTGPARGKWPNGQGLMKKEKKENIIQISKLIARFRKLITKNLVAEIIGKKS